MTGSDGPQADEPEAGGHIRLDPAGPPSVGRHRVCVVGSGTRFLSGISYYTDALARALSREHTVTVILMRQLLPTRFYPGRTRVGKELARFDYGNCETLDGVDWTVVPTIFRAWRALRRWQPDVLLLQWWTGTVLHNYILLALVARMLGTKTVLEFHEVLDTGEDRIPLARAYVRVGSAWLRRLTDGYVVHSSEDLAQVNERFSLDGLPAAVVPHGPYERFVDDPADSGPEEVGDRAFTLLCFGVLRPYKGVDVLLEAFDQLSHEEAGRYRLLLVGETWEDWQAPARMVAASRHRDRIEFVNRYVHDREVAGYFRRADAVVLPYRRSSASGPLSIAMSRGMPVAVSSVGGLPDAVAGYEGAVLVPPGDPEALREAFARLREMRGLRFQTTTSWHDSVQILGRLFRDMGVGEAPEERAPDAPNDVRQKT